MDYTSHDCIFLEIYQNDLKYGIEETMFFMSLIISILAIIEVMKKRLI